jgi:alpha-glucoside transport system substrate-binding protein
MFAAMALVVAACGDDDDDAAADEEAPEEDGAAGEDTGTVDVLTALAPDAEGAIVDPVVDEMINAEADYTVEMENAAGDFTQQFQIRGEAGTLDVAWVPQPGQIADVAVPNGAVSLEEMGFDIAELEETYGEGGMALGEVDGQHYAIPTAVSLKSMIWYPVDDFEAAGYEVPETFDDLIALSDQIVEDGGTPWCVGYEDGDATGWPATDWMEDIMLAGPGPEVYDQWVNHEIPFDDEAVQTAGERFGEIMFGDGYVLGGADQTPSIAFGDAPAPMFDDPPGCWLHRQASFIPSFFPEDAEAGVDYDWFPFPAIEQQGALLSGNLVVAFRDAPEVRDFLERFSSEEVQCAIGEDPESSLISPNSNVGPDCYGNEIIGGASEVVLEALAQDTGRFDASDQMPPQVGSDSFWTEMMAYMQGGPDSLQTVLQNIEQTWPE